jgi:hypothetical protein
MPVFFVIAAIVMFGHGAAFVSIQAQKEKAAQAQTQTGPVVAQAAPADAPVGP